MPVVLEEPEGSIGEVTGRVAKDTIGEVIVPFKGGKEAFYALPVEEGSVFDVGEQVLVVMYTPTRMVYVTAWPPEETKSERR